MVFKAAELGDNRLIASMERHLTIAESEEEGIDKIWIEDFKESIAKLKGIQRS